MLRASIILDSDHDQLDCLEMLQVLKKNCVKDRYFHLFKGSNLTLRRNNNR